MKSKLFCPYPEKQQSPLGERGEADLTFGNAQDIPRGSDLGGQKIKDVPATPYSTSPFRSK